MLIIGCDYHPGFQQIAWVDTDTGELGERRLAHRQEAEQFYRKLKEEGLKVRVGMEASGHAHWFERLLRELQFELWIGDAALLSAKKHEVSGGDREVQAGGPGTSRKCGAVEPRLPGQPQNLRSMSVMAMFRQLSTLRVLLSSKTSPEVSSEPETKQ